MLPISENEACYHRHLKRRRCECDDYVAGKTMRSSTAYKWTFWIIVVVWISYTNVTLSFRYPMVRTYAYNQRRCDYTSRSLQWDRMNWRQRQCGHSCYGTTNMNRFTPTIMTNLYVALFDSNLSRHRRLSCKNGSLRLQPSSESLNEALPQSTMVTTQLYDINQSELLSSMKVSSRTSSATTGSYHNIETASNPLTSSFRQQQVPRTTTNSEFEFLNTFPDAGTLYIWIQTLVTNSTSKHRIAKKLLRQGSNSNFTVNYLKNGLILPSPSNLNSLRSLHDHISFLSAIGHHSIGTTPSIIQYVRFISKDIDGKDKSSVDFYLAAFQALAHQKLLHQRQHQHGKKRNLSLGNSQNDIQTACMDIVHMMKKNAIITSSKVMAILVPLYCGYTSYDAIHLRHHLLRYYPNIIWSESIWILAIQACCCESRNNEADMFSSSSPSYMIRIRTAVSEKMTKHSFMSESNIKNVSISNSTTAILCWECATQLYSDYINSTTATANKKVTENDKIAMLPIPSERICMTMLQLCIVTKNVTGAMTFVNLLLRSAPPNSAITTQPNTNGIVHNGPNSQMTQRLWAMLLKVCVVAGDHKTAYEVLRQMVDCNQVPNVRHCTAYLQALIESNELDKSEHFLTFMAGSSHHRNRYFHNLTVDGLPDMIAVKTVLNGCTLAGNYTLARHLCDNIKNGCYGADVQMDEQCFNMLLSTCSNSTVAKDILREIRLTRRHRWGVVRASAITYTKAIAVCRKSRDVESARSFLSLAKNDGIPPDSFMYSSVIWVAAQCNDADVAIEILNEMIECNTTPTIVSYNGVFSALASSGNVDMILEIFQDMKRSHSRTIHPNFMSYFHIARCLQKLKEDEERLAYLWRVYALMDSRDRQVKVGGHLLEALIQTYGALGHFDEAMNVFDSISGLSNSACLRAVLFACSAAEPPEWETAMSLLHASDIVDDGVGPGLVEPGALCNTMLACSKAGEWEESLQLMRLYGDQSDLSIVAVNSLIAACGRAGRPDMSMEVLYEVEGRGMKLDTRSYRSTIIACNQAEHVYRRSLQLEQLQRQDSKETVQTNHGFEWWECAISLLRRMKESGLQPDTPTLSSTISACEAAGQWQRALHILQSAMNDNVSVALNVYCFNAAISACEKGGAWVEALEIYEKMKEQGGTELRPNLVTVSSLILALDNAGQKEFAVNVYREGLRKRYIQTPWRLTKDSSSSPNEPIMAMDLHSYSAAMTRAAIRNHMDTLLSRPGKGTMMTNMDTATTISDWTIIVGQGYHSIDGRPILKDTVMNVLRVEYGIDAVVDDRNFGRILIPVGVIQQFISKRRW